MSHITIFPPPSLFPILSPRLYFSFPLSLPILSFGGLHLPFFPHLMFVCVVLTAGFLPALCFPIISCSKFCIRYLIYSDFYSPTLFKLPIPVSASLHQQLRLFLFKAWLPNVHNPAQKKSAPKHSTQTSRPRGT